LRVLIIGGGTGGMCLAQGLRRAGVPVEVYERDRTRSDGLHGYRVGINPTGNRALKECLPPELFETFIATCARSPRYFNVLTEKLKFTATIPPRQQYLSHAKVKDAGIIAIGGKVPITAETRALLPPRVFNGLSLVFAPGGHFCIWHVMEFKWDDDGQVKGNIGGNDAELIAKWPGLLFDNTRDYINWGFWSSTDRYPPGVMDLRREDLIRLVLEMTPNWHPNMRKLFTLSDPGSCFPINIRTSVPVEPWQSSTITLLGDAIHTMTPGQGVGANTALRDAALLCRQLVAAHQGSKPLLEAVADYEAEMIPYGFARVADSLAQNGTSGDDPLYKPGIGRVMLAATRTYFRAVNRIPALRRQFLNSLYTYRSS
jgi:2-polyprenyl-6-methoxyphenol hydroxylase-like FAD-dependent oxidoreductase